MSSPVVDATLFLLLTSYQSVAKRRSGRRWVEHLLLALNSGDVHRLTQTMERIAQRVLPEFR